MHFNTLLSTEIVDNCDRKEEVHYDIVQMYLLSVEFLHPGEQVHHSRISQTFPPVACDSTKEMMISHLIRLYMYMK